MVEVNENEILEQAVSTVTKFQEEHVSELRQNGLTEFIVVNDDYVMRDFPMDWAVLCYDPSRVSDPEDFAAAWLDLDSKISYNDYASKYGIEILMIGEGFDDMLKEYNDEGLGLRDLWWEYEEQYGHGVDAFIQMINDTTGLNLTENNYYSAHYLSERQGNGQVNDSKKTHTMRTRRVKDSDDTERFSEFLYQIEDVSKDSYTLFPMLVSITDSYGEFFVTFEALTHPTEMEIVMTCETPKGSYEEMVSNIISDMRQQIQRVSRDNKQIAEVWSAETGADVEDCVENNYKYIDIYTMLADYIEDTY